MNAQRASAPARIAAVAAAFVLVAVAAAVAVRLAGRREASPPKPALVAPPPQDRAVDRKERVRHEEYEAGRLVAEIRGDAFSRGADGLNRLTGSVEVKYFGPEGQTVSRLTCGEIAYAPGSLRFAVRGAVRVEAGDVVLEGESFEYDKSAGLFATSSGGRFSSGTFAGGAPEVSYRESADEIRLGGRFRVEIAAKEGIDRALTLSGDALVVVRREHSGRVTGRAGLESTGFQLAGPALTFAASPDGSSLDTAVVEGAAEAAFKGKGATGEGSGELRAGRIAVRFSRDPYGLGIKASLDSVLFIRPVPENTVVVRAPEIILSVWPGDHIPTWEATGGFRAEAATAGGPRWTLEGERGHTDGGTIFVSGRPGETAVADSAEARIEAPEITVHAADLGLCASRSVVGTLKATEAGRRIAFFSPQEDVSFSASRAEYLPDGSIYLLTGNVVVRQGPNALKAYELELGGTAGRMSGARDAVITLTEAAQGGQARTVEMGGQAMAYRPDLRTLRLTTKAYVKLPEARLEAGAVSAVIGRESRAVESLSAAGGVTVTKGAYTGRAEAATYDPLTGLLALTGSPVLTDGKGGSARGDKLTFDLAGDKILVENEGPGRSTTVIRS
jgi:lipopolysaccharide export system protein LptA